MITKPSPHTVAATVDRLEAALTAKGIAIVARRDHAAAAAIEVLDPPTTAVQS